LKRNYISGYANRKRLNIAAVARVLTLSLNLGYEDVRGNGGTAPDIVNIGGSLAREKALYAMARWAPRDGLDSVQMRETSFSSRESNSRSPVVRPVI
jgi:hypothetical protein